MKPEGKVAENTRHVPVAMARQDLDGIPQFSLPEPFTFRWYQPGDEKEWTRIHVQADKWNDVSGDLFEKQFGNDEDLLRERQLYLCADDGAAVGTATAWWNDDYEGLMWGRLHWVAIVPEFQGRGLAKPLLSAVLNRMVEMGYKRVYLTTATQRLPAISLYLKFGFLPQPRNQEETEAWKEVVKALGIAGPLFSED